MKILVVEDTPKHIEDARAFFKKQGVSVEVAKTLADSTEWLRAEKFDGVISDIYFLHTTQKPWNIEIPGGLAVLMYCQKKGIPCVLNTAGYHHGAKYEWINGLMRRLELPDVIDASNDYHKEAETKDWSGAWSALREQFKK